MIYDALANSIHAMYCMVSTTPGLARREQHVNGSLVNDNHNQINCDYQLVKVCKYYKIIKGKQNQTFLNRLRFLR